MEAEDALDFVRKLEGEPAGFAWRIKPPERYQIIDAWLSDDSMPMVVDSLKEAVAGAARLGSRFRAVPGPECAAWGIVTQGPQFLPETTPWNGRGNGEPPDFEFAVELVKEDAPAT